ncbi:ATP-binding protein [Paracoccus sp. (in: a-proteobacteria)]|uniref:ATP-binding protein n=1 Tax=Paracoccus sp. TaxID=267 RepID=UPI00289FBBB8|nr:ATP-binding protein [Paracoccus sp. (in: a-proteobacteria)]
MTNPFVIEEIVETASKNGLWHYPFERGAKIQRALAQIFSRHLGGLRSGTRFETEGLLVTGKSGAGKTSEVNHIIKSFNASGPILPDGRTARIVSCMLDAKGGWKGLGTMTLAALGYPLADTARNTQIQIWRKVIQQAKGQGVVGIYYDEAQHIFRGKSEREQLAILDSLKTLMKSEEWPLILIFSGVPELHGYLYEEEQLFRLLTEVELKDIDLPQDFDTLHELVSNMALDAGLDPAPTLATEDFYHRLATGAGFRWGLAIMITNRAIEACHLVGGKILTVEHFVQGWMNKTGMAALASPFLNKHYVSAFPKDRLFWNQRVGEETA